MTQHPTQLVAENGRPKSPTPWSWRRVVRSLLSPVSDERRSINRRRWQSLPEHLRVPQQTMGRGHHSCGATHGVMERCNFACTSCYLSSVANATPPLEQAEVHRQLDELRAFLGPQGKAQITSGEVTLLPLEVLGGYVSYARRIGLDPMVMTHGQRFLDEPEYLRRLVADFGLMKLSVHVDSTQRGRRGWHRGQTERELDEVRSRYAQLIRRVRRETGRTVHAATTVTVTEHNLDQISDIVDWVLDNADAFRMISFQPVAAVGRTQDERISDLGLDDVWQRICAGLGRPVNRHALYFGHPECHIICPVVVVRAGGERWVVETSRQGKRWDQAFLDRLMNAIGGFMTYDKPRWLNALQLLGLAAKHPLFVLEAPAYGLYRLWGLRRALGRLLGHALRLRRISIQPLAVVVHKFMSPEELETPLGRERLAACVFQLPVDGTMIPMCQMNATELRLELNQDLRNRASQQEVAAPRQQRSRPLRVRDNGRERAARLG